MSALAEEMVAEWLNRQGFFTIRGRREGNVQLDLLALRWKPDGPECWHYEVQVSLKPVSYISKYSLSDQKRLGVPAGSARTRNDEELQKLVSEWVKKKFRSETVRNVREALCKSGWSEGFVHGVVKSKEELRLIESNGIRLVDFSTVIGDLVTTGKKRQGAGGSDLAELLAFIPKSMSR